MLLCSVWVVTRAGAQEGPPGGRAARSGRQHEWHCPRLAREWAIRFSGAAGQVESAAHKPLDEHKYCTARWIRTLDSGESRLSVTNPTSAARVPQANFPSLTCPFFYWNKNNCKLRWIYPQQWLTVKSQFFNPLQTTLFILYIYLSKIILTTNRIKK